MRASIATVAVVATLVLLATTQQLAAAQKNICVPINIGSTTINPSQIPASNDRMTWREMMARPIARIGGSTEVQSASVIVVIPTAESCF